MSTAQAVSVAEGRDERRRQAGVALLLLVFAPSVGVLASMVWLPGPAGQVVYGLAKVWLAVLPVAWWRWVDRQPLSLSPARRGGFGVAAGVGLLISAIVVAGYAVVGRHVIDAEAFAEVAAGNGLDSLAKYLGLVAYLVLVNSVMEEYVWRWFVFRKLEVLAGGAGSTGGVRGARWAGAVAVVGSAGLFSLHHAIALGLQFGWLITVMGTLGVFVGGAVWSWMYLRYRSIWPGYVSHAIVDVAVFGVGAWMLFG